MISSTQPAAFLETEDGVAPRPIWHAPPWFTQNVTVIWLVRTDRLRLPLYHPPSQANHLSEDLEALTESKDNTSDEASAGPDTALLQLLQAQDGAMNPE